MKITYHVEWPGGQLLSTEERAMTLALRHVHTHEENCKIELDGWSIYSAITVLRSYEQRHGVRFNTYMPDGQTLLIALACPD